MAEQDYLRLEAMDLFERCLTEGNPSLMNNFIQQQIAENPPHLTLLQDVAEDLQQRLIGLREYHTVVCDRILLREREDFRSDSRPSVAVTTQLHEDVLMTERLLDTLTDWIDALTTVEVRRSWGNTWRSSTPDPIH